MNTDNMVFRSVYVDHDVDKVLLDHAAKANVSKGEIYRRYLELGMNEARKTSSLVSLPKKKESLTLRTVYLPFKMDEALRGQAFDRRTTKSDLIRQYLKMGILVALAEHEAPVAKVARDAPAAQSDQARLYGHAAKTRLVIGASDLVAMNIAMDKLSFAGPGEFLVTDDSTSDLVKLGFRKARVGPVVQQQPTTKRPERKSAEKTAPRHVANKAA